jgi:hypothetical protein
VGTRLGSRRWNMSWSQDANSLETRLDTPCSRMAPSDDGAVFGKPAQAPRAASDAELHADDPEAEQLRVAGGLKSSWAREVGTRTTGGPCLQLVPADSCAHQAPGDTSTGLVQEQEGGGIRSQRRRGTALCSRALRQ